jgi:hypothetical protein
MAVSFQDLCACIANDYTPIPNLLKEGENKKYNYFSRLLKIPLSGRTFRIDNRSRKIQALTAFWFSPKLGIDIAGIVQAATNRRPQVFFLYRIAHANNHILLRCDSYNANDNISQ